MPGYLSEILANERHFALLRLAQLRQLRARRLNGGVWAVSSHSRPGHFHTVTAGVCSCPSVGYCSHLALAVDTELRRSAEAPAYLEYTTAQREDFAALELRVLLGNTSAEDRAYVKPQIERVRERQPRAETPKLAGASF